MQSQDVHWNINHKLQRNFLQPRPCSRRYYDTFRGFQTDFPQAPVRRGAGYLVVVSRWNVTSGGKQPATWIAGHTVCFMLPLHYSSDGNVVFRHHLLFKKANVRAHGGAAAGRLWLLISLFVGWDLLPWSLHVLAMPESVSFGLFGFLLLSKNLHIEIIVTVHWEWM